jgi:transposase
MSVLSSLESSFTTRILSVTRVLTMSERECYRLKVLTQVQQHQMTFREAAEHLQISERQVYRVMARYRRDGDAGVVHRLRGKPSNRGHGANRRTQVVGLYRQQYADYGPTLFAEQLVATHSIAVDHETVRRWLRADGITHFERRHRKHRRQRERRSAIGELVQFDGSPHDWFEGRGAPCCFLGAVDDASGRTFARLVPSENTADVLATLRAYCERYGIPKSLYIDHGSVFYAAGRLTDVGRAMKTLGVEMIFAHSPQAKGRIERTNRTYQDRFIKALRRRTISTIADANAFLDAEYLNEHNKRFAHTEGLPDVHRSCEGYDLTNIFCFQTERCVRQDYTITLDGQYIQLERSDAPLPPPRHTVIVRRWLDGTLHIFWHEHELQFTRLKQKPHPHARVPRKPAADHPWRLKAVGRAKFREGTPVALRAPSVPSHST